MNEILSDVKSAALYSWNTGNCYVLQPTKAVVDTVRNGLGYVESSLDSVAGFALDVLHLRPHAAHGKVTSGTADRMFRASLLSTSVVSLWRSNLTFLGLASVGAGNTVLEASPSMWATFSRVGSISVKFLPLKDLSGQISGLSYSVSKLVFGLDLAEKAEGFFATISSLSGVTDSVDGLSGAAQDLGISKLTLRGAVPILSPMLAIMSLASVVLHGVNFHRKHVFRQEMLEILENLDREDSSSLYTRDSLKRALESLRNDETDNSYRPGAFFSSRFKLSRDLSQDLQAAIKRLDNVADATIQRETEELLTQLRGRITKGMLSDTVLAIAGLTGSVASHVMLIAPAAPIGGLLLTACLSMYLASSLFGLYNYTFQPVEIKNNDQLK